MKRCSRCLQGSHNWCGGWVSLPDHEGPCECDCPRAQIMRSRGRVTEEKR